MSHISADDPLVIAIDSSTTSTKAIVVDTQGNVISLGRREIALLSPEQGFGEHDPRQWWTSTHEAVGEAVGKLTPAEKERIAAFGITHQRESFAPFTADGTPLRNGILWLDIRAADQILRYGTPEIHQLSGKPADVTPAIYKMAWVKEHQPDLWASAEKVTTVSAYIAFCLTGSWVDSTACADSLGLFDIAKLDYDEGLLQIAGVRRDQMAGLVKPGQTLGALKPELAKEWGVAEIPVIAGCGDGQAAGVGAAAVSPDVAYLNMGTAVVAVWATSSTLVAADSPLRREASPLEPLGPLRGWGLEGARSPTPTEVVVPEEVGAPLWWTAPASAGSMREA